MASVVAGGNRKKSLTLRGVDPETCMIVFRNHWAQVTVILEKHEPSRCSSGAFSFLSGHHGGGGGASRLGPIPADEASAVQNYVEHMLFLLMEEEAGRGGAMGPILELVVLEGVMERLFLWSLRRQFTEDMKLEQLRMYQMLLSQAKQPLLHHKPVLRPLMMLLASCAGAAAGRSGGGVVEAELVLLLNQLCAALVKDPSVLELFFHSSEDQGAANFLLFSLLIPYIHRQGLVGHQAREALLLIMSLSSSDQRVAQHIADNTYFCPVLATGLSGLYSSLPTRLQVYSEDWHCLDPADWQQFEPILVVTLNQVAHPSIRSQLLGYIYDGFLVPVLAPALLCVLREVMTTTAYLDLFLRSISEPALLQIFLSFILLHTHDNVYILDTLVSRVNTPFQLGTVSLALFRTLIGLFCEDVMLQLVFRYLIPCSHLSRRQRRSLKQRDCYSSSAASFLLLMPSWCPNYLHSTNALSEHIHWPKGAGRNRQNPPVDLKKDAYLNSCPSDLSVSDSVGYCRASDFLMDVNYLHYLWDARHTIANAQRACRFWSAPYDGTDPPAQDSALDLEWDDIFAGQDLCLSPSPSLPNGSEAAESGRSKLSPTPPQVLPLHIQEMQRTATKLVHGSYVEESEFLDDVQVYDLVARKDAKSAVLERMRAANQKASGSSSKGLHSDLCSDTNSLPNGHCEPQTPHVSANPPGSKATKNSSFLSQYCELMHSLGVEPDCDDMDDHHETFQRRVQALRQKLKEEDEFSTDFLWEEAEEEGETMEEEEEKEEERSSSANGSRRHGVPCTGPFISVLLSRLENLLENSISVNLLLTGILVQLVSYPQPLLRSFLLSTEPHSQPSVRTLHQVLVSVHAQIERYVEDRPDYPALVTQAWRFLLAKDQDCKFRGKQTEGNHTGVAKGKKIIPPHAKSRVFAIVLFAEFLKELAAFAQEQSIAPDWWEEFESGD
uniref:FHF complex subunit HOOK-interacting protein C-terminal domain-containing protein n=1 Tax=Oryzias latipes TaxID=8090 RepID=A0A3P9IA56_ORYLA